MLLLLLVAMTDKPAQAALSEAEMSAFLVQCIGSDQAGRPTLPTSLSEDCTAPGLQTAAAPLAWSKHDYGDASRADEDRLGQQASDSVLDERLSLPIVVQTFDFGNAGRRFGSFDHPVDGGDALLVLDGAAWIFLTEDGGNGQQWFMGQRCSADLSGVQRFESWLSFGDDAVVGRWTDRVATYKMVRSPSECPFFFMFGHAYTRYRRDTIDVPIRVVDGDKTPARLQRPVDSIVSEHFGGPDIDHARHMERFFFGRGLGKYRWESWEERSRTRLPDAEARAQAIAASRRCLPIAHGEPPAEGWVMSDCRMWTNLVRQLTPTSVTDFGWPGMLLGQIGRLAP